MTANKGPKRALGDRFESSVCKHLSQRGLKLLARNYQCKLGELDIVMLDHGTIVFIEVKYRRSHHFGFSAEQVTPGKQQKLVKAAKTFLAEHVQYQSLPARFDVVGVSGEPGRPEINWIKGAFYAS